MAKELASRKWPKVNGLPAEGHHLIQWLAKCRLAGDILDIVLDVPLQGVAAVGEGCVVGGPDVQLVKVLQEQQEKNPSYFKCFN